MIKLLHNIYIQWISKLQHFQHEHSNNNNNNKYDNNKPTLRTVPLLIDLSLRACADKEHTDALIIYLPYLGDNSSPLTIPYALSSQIPSTAGLYVSSP